MSPGEVGGGFEQPKVGRGLAYGDFDRDGDLDILMTTNNGPAFLYRNDQTGEIAASDFSLSARNRIATLSARSCRFTTTVKRRVAPCVAAPVICRSRSCRSPLEWANATRSSAPQWSGPVDGLKNSKFWLPEKPTNALKAKELKNIRAPSSFTLLPWFPAALINVPTITTSLPEWLTH